ncbi:MAG TPA: N-acetylmuramidase domain-containing protein [Bauldia sp.]|nr:N-acetylmuramidase domain-containing protein [Bauldia sp.]
MADEFIGKGAPLDQAGFDAAQAALGGDPESLWAILAVETRGFGFLADRRQKILFERHIFYKYTKGKFSAANPDISSPTAGGYSGGAAEYARLAKAIALDRDAALQSASWGLGQIMGFNAVGLNYSSAANMIATFKDGENAQLDGCARFINASSALKEAFVNRDWVKVAFFYNGKDYAKNKYDTKLQQHYDLYRLKGVPDIEVRAAQARLTYLGFDPGGIDGAAGKHTAMAVLAFQKTAGLPLTGDLDEATKAALVAAAGV